MQMRAPLLALALTSTLILNALGQQPQQQQPVQSPAAPPALPQQETDEGGDDVVRITTKLVQVDAVVTNKDGRQVTGLTADDFEILENGKPQTITNFSFVTTAAPLAHGEGQPEKKDKERGRSLPSVPVPAGRLRPENINRSIALVIDDLRMSAESVNAARNSLRKYVEEQMQPGDLVAIIRTSTGVGALQQFTHDKQQLHAAIDRVRVMPRAGIRLGAFTDVNTLSSLEASRDGAIRAHDALADPILDRTRTENLNEFRDSLVTVGTIGALNFVVRGLRDLPGRKAVVLFSDGISIFPSAADNSQFRDERVFDAMRRLVDNANRASVVFYAIDTRGLQPANFTAADDTSGSPAAPGGTGPAGSLSGIGATRSDQMFSARTAEIFEGQNGLRYLAHETGGQTLFNQNDFNKGISRALEDMRAFYLIGYRPDDSTFDTNTGQRRFVKLTVKVRNRSDLKVRTRTGFLNIAEEQTRERKRSRTEQLMAALLSPFSAGGVNLQLTPFFMNDAGSGSSIRSVLLMDARNLTFTPQPDGRQQTVFDVVAVTFGEDGQVVDQVAVVETVRVKPEALDRFMREGMLFGMNVPVAKPGAYQLRVAVRDAASGRIGSASQYIEVPNVNKDRLAMSSLVVMGNKPAATARDLIGSVLGAPVPSGSLSSSSSSAALRLVAGGDGMTGTEVAQAGPASRRFSYGMYLDYACVVFNARRDKSKRPQVTTQVRLFHENKEVFVGEVLPLETGGQTDLGRLVVARRLQLGTILEPGDYVLHLTVTDATASEGRRTTTGWIDFKLAY